MTSLKGKVAIVTGAGRGIGRAIAVKLAQCGAEVVLVDLEAPAESAKLAGDSAMAFAGDVSIEATWAKLGHAIDERFNRLDIVVNNAAAFPRGLIDELDFDTWRRGFAVNLDAQFYSAKHFVPRMRKNGYGRFIAISSNSIGIAEQALSAYIATKMGAIGFMRGLANDVAADGITCNAILPSLTDTPATAGMPEDAKRAVWQQQAIKRIAEPRDLVGPVAFLASEEAGFITGQALVVDGGLYKVS
ncbi:SDR family oxidoreductase [Paraburkholderia madseniana]|jgi:3-oxoacyl-[acyl-carrier protein] reductase|uniref:SDR family oxidoreductase n=1 Tax=Paraburkholderia madseniana TaxID=2599607 RepID=A0A6N6W6D9_9BURK|nr:SDR family NAD(P)-dependent oxidoreductase [Paraburkholderia madseniana]KAE8755130.1 SDR family oxidoreductase [Paraburkholderia madseniana]